MLCVSVVCVLLVVAGSYGAIDLTITDKAIGSDVVEAAIDIIHQSCIFDDDKLLLRRIAYAETEDGLAANTFKHEGVDFYGGIWQISQEAFIATQKSANASVYVQIKSAFAIEWTAVSYSDLVKPLYSALAARLKIDAYYNTTDIPQSVDAQAEYWAKFYTINSWGSANVSTNVTIDVYVTASASIITTCSAPKADIVFVLDGSGSIGADNFANVRSFVADVVGSFDISQQKVRIGLIEFSSTAVTEFDLTTYDTSLQVQAAVRKIPYFSQGTNTAAALDSMKNMIEKEGRQQDGVAVISIVMTDGKSNNPVETAVAAKSVHSQLPEVTVFAVGVGNSVDVAELDVIASQPSCLHVFQLSGFEEVTSFTSQIMDQACKVPAQLQPSDPISGVVTENQRYYFKLTVHKQKKGVKVQIKTSSGGVKTYFSWKSRNPSPALYDYTTDADDKMTDGSVLEIPWNDEAAKTNSRRKRSTDDETATIYGSVVGAQQKPNQFNIVYKDAPPTKNSSAVVVASGSLSVGLLALIVAIYQQY